MRYKLLDPGVIPEGKLSSIGPGAVSLGGLRFLKLPSVTVLLTEGSLVVGGFALTPS